MNITLTIVIGTSGGRHNVDWRENGEIGTEDVYRFPNGIKQERGHLVWDLQSLFQSVKAGIAAAFKKYPQIESLSIDTWDYDYVLMQGDQEILPCYAYPDHRTEAVRKRVQTLIPFEELYERTGIGYQPFNTICQLSDDECRGRLEIASDFLMISEYLIYKLTGIKCKEYTNAVTTGLVNATTKKYDQVIIHRLGFPERLFPALQQPKTVVGRLTEAIAEDVGGQTQVVLCAHTIKAFGS